MKLINYFLNITEQYSLRKKLVCIYAVIYCIFLLLLIFVLNSVLGKTLFEHEESLLQSTLNQSVTHMETRMNGAVNLADIIQNNDDIISAVNVNYGTRYFQMYSAYANVIKPELNIYKYLIPEISNICLYSACDIYPNRDYVQALSVLEEKPWFPKVKDMHTLNWITETLDGKEMLALVRKLPKNKVYPFDNYLYLELDYSNFFQSTISINSEEYGVIILDSNKNLVYEYDSFLTPSLKIDRAYFQDFGLALPHSISQNYILLTEPIEHADWTLYYYSPVSTIRSNVTHTVFLVFVTIAFCFTLLLLLTLYLIDTILSPLQQVTQKIGKLSLNDIEKAQELNVSNTSSEVNALVHTFNTMLKRIQNLIEEAYIRNLTVKEYQLKSLRAQINPHFLYNTLSSINARAIVAEQDEISETVQLLSTFYRTSLNRGEDFTTIGEEIKNVQSYISIQQILTDYAFHVNYQLDETCFSLQIPCFILQPIVENAIEHGLMSSRKPDRTLDIQVFREQNLCTILIRDNGCGIPSDVSATIFSLERSHIGIKNVHERLRLSYGDSMGLIIHSQINEGTEVLVRVPADFASGN